MGISVRWLGYASFEIKAAGKNIYIDPYKGEYREEADLILVTHSHNDHCDPSKIKKIRKDDTLIIAPEDCISKIGEVIKTLTPGQKLTVGNITVEAIEAYNYKRFRSPGNPYHPKGLGVGYLVTVGDKTIYHAGDTDFIPEMKQLRQVHLALLPSGNKYTMDNEEAAEAALTIKPEAVIPMHLFDTNPKVFKKKVEDKSKINVVVFQPGEQFEVE